MIYACHQVATSEHFNKKKKRKNILKLEAKNNYRSYHTSIHLIPIPALLLIASIFKSI